MLLSITGQSLDDTGIDMGKPFCRNSVSLLLFISVICIACLLGVLQAAGGDLMWSS